MRQAMAGKHPACQRRVWAAFCPVSIKKSRILWEQSIEIMPQSGKEMFAYACGLQNHWFYQQTSWTSQTAVVLSGDVVVAGLVSRRMVVSPPFQQDRLEWLSANTCSLSESLGPPSLHHWKLTWKFVKICLKYYPSIIGKAPLDIIGLEALVVRQDPSGWRSRYVATGGSQNQYATDFRG